MSVRGTTSVFKSVLLLLFVAMTMGGCGANAVPHVKASFARQGSRAAAHSAHRAAQTISMTHILDFESIGQGGHRTDLTWQALSPFLTADEPGNAQSLDASSAGIRVGWYTDAAIQHAGD